MDEGIAQPGPLARDRKYRAKRFNEGLKLAATLFNSSAIATIGSGPLMSCSFRNASLSGVPASSVAIGWLSQRWSVAATVSKPSSPGWPITVIRVSPRPFAWAQSTRMSPIEARNRSSVWLAGR